MGDTLRVIPVLDANGERVIRDGKLLVQNQSDNVLMYVPTEYFVDISTNTSDNDGRDNVREVDYHNPSYDEVTEEHVIEDTNEFEDTVKFSWTHRATRLFLRFFFDNRELVQSRQLKNWKALWDKIARDMNSVGFNVDSAQVENKYKSLKRSYNDMVLHNAKGVEQKHIEFESELEDVFSKKHHKKNRSLRARKNSRSNSYENRITASNMSEEQNHSKEDIIEFTEESIEKTEFAWPPSATKLLLESYSINRELHQSHKLRSSKALWNKISQELNESGFEVSPTKAKIRYENLKKSYKEMVRHNKKTRVEPMHIEFEDELGELFAKNPYVDCTVISGAKGVRIQTSCFGKEQFVPLCKFSNSVFKSRNLDEDDNYDPRTSICVNENSEINSGKTCQNTIEENLPGNKSSKRKRRGTADGVLEETLDIFRNSSKRRSVFQSQIEELYKKEVENVQHFRRESLDVKNRKLNLLERFIHSQQEKAHW